jgi:hypothetical protein
VEHERFMELCKLVSPEQDLERLAALIAEINDLLDIKYHLRVNMHLIDRVN